MQPPLRIQTQLRSPSSALTNLLLSLIKSVVDCESLFVDSSFNSQVSCTYMSLTISILSEVSTKQQDSLLLVGDRAHVTYFADQTGGGVRPEKEKKNAIVSVAIDFADFIVVMGISIFDLVPRMRLRILRRCCVSSGPKVVRDGE